MSKKTLLAFALVSVLFIPGQALGQAASTKVPTVDDLLNLQTIGGAQISPDGNWVAYTVTSADWKQDAFVSHVWVIHAPSGRSFQVTRGEKPCSNPSWSPDGGWLAFTSSRVGDKNQIFVIRPDGGEAVQLTGAENGVGGYAWSTDGKQIAFTSSDLKEKDVKARRDYAGDFEVVRREYTHQHLRTLDVAAALMAPAAGTERTKGKAFSVSSFSWSPDNTRIAFSAAVNPDLIQGSTSDIYLLDLASDAVRKLVDSPGPDSSPRWSPDGRMLVFSSAMGNPKHFHANSRLAVVSADGGTPRSITDAFDEQPNLVDWLPDGVYFGASQKTASHLLRVDPGTGRVSRISQPDALMLGGASFTRDGKSFAFTAASPSTLSEIYLSAVQPFAPRKLTSMTGQAAGYRLGRREVISWKSKDGTDIEGVLIKPRDFDPARSSTAALRHPRRSDGRRPADDDRCAHLSGGRVGDRGALILKVNYRGSAGYGEQFRQLNYRNLGVGDAWDVISGVEHLVKLGFVDPKRVGCMGWSQGGYISAFLTTSSTAFVAISVGAGISDWRTYYYNTDITPFTVKYLGADPVADPAIYAKTSPVDLRAQAKTPTLIQHGELDRRVPIANAYQLRQALEDRGVPVEMVVYKGFGHGVTKPKAARAVMLHNLGWFNHYIFGDPLPDFTKPDLPKEK